jgi:DNA-directed RNA polymerase subunit alpha
LTVGNALRRVLLSALEGYAITSFVLKVDHEFSTIQELLKMLPKLSLIKQVRFRQIEDMIMNQLLFLFQVKTAGFSKIYFRFQVLNPELVICNLDSKIKLNFDLTIEKVEDMFLLRRTKKNKCCNWNYFTDSILLR